MHSVDFDVLHTARRWFAEGRTVWLATVVRTWGSAPRPVGSLMAVRDDGQVVGSVSGGCIEDDLIARLRDASWRPAAPTALIYGATEDEARRFNLPCGGTLQIVLEPVAAHSRLDELADALAARRVAVRTLDMASGEASLAFDLPPQSLRFDGAQLVAEFGPRYRLLLIGAGPVSRYLAEMASALDYQVVVCEPREEHRETWDVAGVPLSSTMPDDLILEMGVDGKTAIVALTHDPKLDDMALLEALVSPAFYVGAIGSRRNSEARRARLMQYFDLTEAQVDRLHGPVGLYIGAATPPEIAVSILAEMTAVRRGVPLAQRRGAAAALPAGDDTGEVCAVAAAAYPGANG